MAPRSFPVHDRNLTTTAVLVDLGSGSGRVPDRLTESRVGFRSFSDWRGLSSEEDTDDDDGGLLVHDEEKAVEGASLSIFAGVGEFSEATTPRTPRTGSGTEPRIGIVESEPR